MKHFTIKNSEGGVPSTSPHGEQLAGNSSSKSKRGPEPVNGEGKRESLQQSSVGVAVDGAQKPCLYVMPEEADDDVPSALAIMAAQERGHRAREERKQERALQRALSKLRFKRVQRQRAAKEYVRDLTKDGDVESNPGPTYRNECVWYAWQSMDSEWRKLFVSDYLNLADAYLQRGDIRLALRHATSAFFGPGIWSPSLFWLFNRHKRFLCDATMMWKLTDLRVDYPRYNADVMDFTSPKMVWVRDLTIDGDVESNPGPVELEALRTAAILASSANGFTGELARVVRALVDVVCAPDAIHGALRFACVLGDDFASFREFVMDLWEEVNCASNQAGGAQFVDAAWQGVLSLASMISLTRLLGVAPDARIRFFVRSVVSVMRDADDFEGKARDAFSFLLKVLPLCVKAGSLDPLFAVSGSPKDVARAFEMLAEASASGDENSCERLDEARLVLERLESSAEASVRPHPLLMSCLAQLRVFVVSADSAARAAAGRPAPFGVEFVGPPGCGKSTFVTAFVKALIDVTGGRVWSGAISTFRPGSKYNGDWLRPHSSAVVFDDALPTKELGAATEHVAMVNLLQTLVSSQAMQLETADLSGKVGMFARPRVVVVAGNKSMSELVRFVAIEPGAISRRLVRVTINSFTAVLPTDVGGALAAARRWDVSIAKYDLDRKMYVDVVTCSKDLDVWLSHLMHMAHVHTAAERRLFAIGVAGVNAGYSGEFDRYMPQNQSGSFDHDLEEEPERAARGFRVFGRAWLFGAALISSMSLWWYGENSRWSVTMPVGTTRHRVNGGYVYTYEHADWTTVSPVARWLLTHAPDRFLNWAVWRTSGKLRFALACEVIQRNSTYMLAACLGLAAAVWAVRRNRAQNAAHDQGGAVVRPGVYDLPVREALYPGQPMPTPDAAKIVVANPLRYQDDLSKACLGRPKAEWKWPYRQPVRPPMEPHTFSGGSDDAILRVARTTVRLFVARVGDATYNEVSGVMLGRGYVLTVAHVFEDFEVCDVSIYFPDGSGGSVTLRRFKLTVDCVAFNKPRDLAVFYVPTLPVTEFLDLTDFEESIEAYHADVALYTVCDKGGLHVRVKDFVNPRPCPSASVEGVMRGPSIVSDHPGVRGDCGAVALNLVKRKVVAIHSFGWGPVRTAFVVCDRPLVSSLLMSASHWVRVPVSFLRVRPHGAFDGYRVACTPDDAAAYTQGGANIALIGVATRRDDMKACWRYTCYSKLFKDDFKLAPSALRPFDCPVEGGLRRVMNPFQNAVSDTHVLRCDVDPLLVRQFVDQFKARIIVPADVKPLDVEQACGPMDPAIRAIDLARAAGPGFPGNKGSYVTRVGDVYVVSERLTSAIRVRQSLYSAGVCFSGYRSFLKDELRTVAKVVVGATRNISVAAFDDYMLARMYINPIMNCILKCRSTVGFAIGANAIVDARVFVRFAQKVSPDLMGIDGDFRWFDQKLAGGTMRVVSATFHGVGTKTAYTSFQLSILWAVLMSLVPRVCSIDTMFIWQSSGNPSGCCGTTLWNSIAVLFYLWVAFIHLKPDGCDADFWECVYALIYGDDFNVFVAPRVRAWYNPQAIASCMLRVLGQEVTAADKTPLGVDFIHLSDMTFLKRRFIKNAVLGEWVLALDLASVTKPLVLAAERSTVLPDVRDGQALVNAYREVWVHGPEVFATWLPRFEAAAAMLPPGVCRFPSVSDMESDFHSGVFTTWDN